MTIQPLRGMPCVSWIHATVLMMLAHMEGERYNCIIDTCYYAHDACPYKGERYNCIIDTCYCAYDGYMYGR